MGALHLYDPEVARQVIAKGLGAKAAGAGIITAMVGFGAAWIGDFPRLWSRAALALCLAVASHFAVAYVV